MKDSPAMMHPDTELRFISDEVGHGVFAVRPIPRGTITWALDEFDLVLPPEQVALLPAKQREQFEEYAYVDQRGRYVLCWDLGRFVNHGCDPTSRGVGPNFEIAVRDIAAGEQLTSDYAELNITARFRCCCGSPRCRIVVGSEDLEHNWAQWDAVVASAVPEMLRVVQPLESFVAHDPLYQAIQAHRFAVPSRREFLIARGAAPVPIPDMVGTGRASHGLWRLAPPTLDLVAVQPQEVR